MTGIGAAAAARGVEVGIRIDLRHTPPEQVVPVAEAVASTAGVRLDGVTIYPSVETTADLADRYAVGRRAAEQAVRAAKAISAAGIDCPVVCVGGTPTAAGAWSVAGVTEVCAGAYATWDGGLARHGVGELAQVAISVAAEATDLLAGCGQPWEPEVTSVAAPEPYAGRLLPAHVCPLAVTLVRRQVEITVVDRGEPVAVWPFAAGDHADRLPGTLANRRLQDRRFLPCRGRAISTFGTAFGRRARVRNWRCQVRRAVGGVGGAGGAAAGRCCWVNDRGSGPRHRVLVAGHTLAGLAWAMAGMVATGWAPLPC